MRSGWAELRVAYSWSVFIGGMAGSQAKSVKTGGEARRIFAPAKFGCQHGSAALLFGSSARRPMRLFIMTGPTKARLRGGLCSSAAFGRRTTYSLPLGGRLRRSGDKASADRSSSAALRRRWNPSILLAPYPSVPLREIFCSAWPVLVNGRTILRAPC